jgi:integrase
MAAQINGQVEVGAPAALSFEPISIPQLRERWLEHHELVLRSSVQSIRRYRTGTDHIMRFLKQRPVRHASLFTPNHAEDFVRYLRTIKVSPNGHENTAKRPLMDKGICYILESCRAMFNFAVKRRHLSPYAENPFSVLDIDRIPIENAKTIVLMTPDEEAKFLEACDGWQLPVFATLMFTGIRPGELCHLLLTDDLDLNAGVLRIRNKPKLGWQVKTRNQRDIPLLPEVVEILRRHVGTRTQGPVFLRRKATPEDSQHGALMLERDLMLAVAGKERSDGGSVDRAARLRLAKSVWHFAGALDEDHVRKEFTRIAAKIGLAGYTAPKILRHQFATVLQEGRVDPLVRNLLMGHATSEHRTAGHGLGMTAVYTHTRPETIREQLLEAFANRPALQALNRRLAPANEHGSQTPRLT